MSEPEQIGPLQFVPNPDYPYPFEVALPPRFWMEEQTGLLGAAVNAYLDGEQVSPEQLDLIGLYLKQYLERAMLPADVKREQVVARLPKLRTTRDIERFADELAEFGIEPF